MNPIDLRQITERVIIILIIGVGLLDVGLAKWGGNRSTISRVMLTVAICNPITIAELCYGFAGLCVHLYLPSIEPPFSQWIRFPMFIIFILPILHLMYELCRIKPVDHFAYPETELTVIYMVLGTLAGASAAYLLVRQHLTAV